MMGNRRIKNLIKISCMAVAVVLTMLLSTLSASALEDGAYLVNRTTSYANPETGETVDGGTNIALGDSMSESIVEESVLVEQSEGKTYVTLGIGMMSNISDVKIQIQAEDKSYHDAEITETGSHEHKGDTCKHFRFAVDSLENYISPILFVEPMGRNVQFFVKLNMDSAKAGTGNFLSEMVQTESAEPDVSSREDTADTVSRQDSQTVTSQSETENSVLSENSDSEHNQAAVQTITQRNQNYLVPIVIVFIVLLAAVIGFLINHKRKNKS